MRRKNILLMVLLVTIPASRLTATVLLFENVRLPIDKEMDGLQSVPGYGDHVTGTGAGGFTDSFSMGNGWTPNIALDFSAGNDRKTVNTWRDGWDGGDGANYLLDAAPVVERHFVDVDANGHQAKPLGLRHDRAPELPERTGHQ